MSDYAPIDSDLILTKKNSIVGIKMTEYPQYKSAIQPVVKLQMAISDRTQLPNIQTKDVDTSLQTMKNIYQYNQLYNTKYSM